VKAWTTHEEAAVVADLLALLADGLFALDALAAGRRVVTDGLAVVEFPRDVVQAVGTEVLVLRRDDRDLLDGRLAHARRGRLRGHRSCPCLSTRFEAGPAHPQGGAHRQGRGSRYTGKPAIRVLAAGRGRSSPAPQLRAHGPPPLPHFVQA